MSNLTPEQRARLVEVLARVCAEWRWGRGSAPSAREIIAMEDAIATAERAGFEWRKKDE